jgi:hypothetical protein
LLKNEKLRNISLIILGILLFLLKQHYNGPYIEFVKSYLGNFSISFVVYFIVGFNAKLWKENKIITAVFAFAIVTLFELTNGFGVMTNVYDVFDLLANLLGISLAFTVDLIVNKYLQTKKQ